jgi:alkylhydroperoxidase/carboxymuconolactone decarboxylase family protein YurZ
MSTDLAPLNADQERLKADFITNRGYWTDLWQTVLTLSPEYFAAYADYSSLPWKEGPLPAKVKEFVYIAITASTTHLFEPGIKVHIKNAFEHGATAGEILEVFQLVSDLGIQTVTVGTAVLEEEVARLRQA